MKKTVHHPECPTCGRRFKSIREYPRVFVLSFEELPVPEALDHHSPEALKRRRARKSEGAETIGFIDEGINRTPEIARLCARDDVQEYLERLSQLKGQIVTYAALRPPFEPSKKFKFAHPIPDTKLFLSVGEEKSDNVLEGVAAVEVYCDGPNMGSAGGPTLLQLGAIGRLRYQGLLL